MSTLLESRRSVLAAVAIASLVIGGALGVLIGDRGATEQLDYYRDLNQAIGGVDAVIAAHVVEVGNVVDGSKLEAVLRVDEILFRSEEPDLRQVYPDYSDTPELSVGDLAVFEALGTLTAPESMTVKLSDNPGIFLLSYRDPSIHKNSPTAWVVLEVAEVHVDGRLGFLGEYNVSPDTQLAPVAAKYADLHPGLAQRDLHLSALLAWIDERVDGRASPSAIGPLQAAFEASIPNPDELALQRWEALPPESRYVDPQTVPPAIAGGLEEMFIFVRVATGLPDAGNQTLILRTNTGVVHQAILEGGSHPASIWVTGGDSVLHTLVVTGADAEPRLIDSLILDREARSKSLIITIGPEVMDGQRGEGAQPITLLVDEAEFRNVLDSWAAEQALLEPDR